MGCEFKNALMGNNKTVNIDGITYDIRISDYSNIGGYAPILIIDKTNGHSYYSDGYIEINGHIFESKWKLYYEPLRENYICSKDLVLTIK